MRDLKEANFSLWCDFIERDFLENDFSKLLENPLINGATSNPAIFKDAFLKSPAYKSDIEQLSGKSAKEIYEALAVKDIKKAANILYPLYKKDDDGFISIEIDPLLCDDFEGSLKEAKRLNAAIDEPNVMIKVPATNAGFKVMRELMSLGINVNATLIFSPTQAQNCLDAFAAGLEEFKKIDLDKPNPKAVISVFVSRFDRKLNEKLLNKKIDLNLVGVINASMIYNLIEAREIKEVRTLFASTGVKGDDLKADYYIKELLFKNSVNTAPLSTIEAFLKNDDIDIIKPMSDSEIDNFFTSLKEADIDMKSIYDELMSEGLEAFKEAFKEILKELEKG
jgi:transaldolase